MSSQRELALQADVNRLNLQLQSYNEEHGTERISIGNYLLRRLEQLGVQAMFGLPGDFNLGFLDLVEDFPTIKWVGNCNELNAAYAADGYARVKEGSLGVVTTTFGVGELSAVNGIAGAFSEMVPVLALTGVPSTAQQKSKPMLHHTLGDGRYDAYEKAMNNFTICQTTLNDKHTAAAQIDRVLTECITKARPVYLCLPTDMVDVKISAARLDIPLSRHLPINDPDTQSFIVEQIASQVQSVSGDVVVLVDACAIRHDVRAELNELLRQTGFPVYATPMGKTAVDENYSRYGGVYVGALSNPQVQEKVESAKLILSVGGLLSDFNTGGFTYHIPTKRIIELHSDHTKVQFAVYPAIGMKQLLPELTKRLKAFQQQATQFSVPVFKSVCPADSSDTITQEWFWPKMGEFFKPRDVIVTETGTANFGILDIPLPEKAVLVNQILWGSIGWSVGSTMGAALAAREMGKPRTLLFVGDGSLQLTVQELSTMIRENLKPIIFVLNNKGYTIERFIHGKHRKYNDIHDWAWTSLLNVLGDLDGTKSRSFTVRTKKEISSLLDDASFVNLDKIRLVEVMMDPLDSPRALIAQAEASAKSNAYTTAL